VSRLALNPAVTSVSAFFPCYNDESAIASVVHAAVKTLDELGIDGEVIVIDDGSTDGSRPLLRELVREEPLLRVIEHEHNGGYGAALRTGFGAATKQWVFYTDGDGQYDPSELRDLVMAATDDVDVVQGYKLGRSDNWSRKVIGRIYHWGTKLMFRLRIRDVDCDFRLIRRSLFERVRLEYSTGVICVELIRKLQDAGARFVEVPVRHLPRLYGRSQFFRWKAIAHTLSDLATLWVSVVLLRRDRPRR
jgi:glycosyltransferase involved in cell wall biosynthesis